MKKFYSTFEIARFCQVSPASVSRWIREGKLPSSVTPGGHHRVRVEDLVALLQSLRIPLPEELMAAETAAVRTVLVVDDEQGIRDMIRWQIEREFPDVHVVDAADGFSAGWKAREVKPDVVILDLRMPGLDGFAVCDLLRRIPELGPLRIIAVSGNHSEETREKVRRAEIDAFLPKPFDVEELVRVLAETLGKKRGNPEGGKRAAG